MSKLYDAIMKAQREQQVQSKKPRPEPQPKPQPVEPRQESDQKAPFMDVRPKITPKKPLIARERITRVSVEKFVAKPDSLMEEQFRKLRGIIAARNLHEFHRSLLITSCLPGEGKTKVAINLSVALARGLD
ncbi:MAG: hypothetical protein ACFFCW_31940, partial [Candidatus Hodarchaeota archaeon]